MVCWVYFQFQLLAVGSSTRSRCDANLMVHVPIQDGVYNKDLSNCEMLCDAITTHAGVLVRHTDVCLGTRLTGDSWVLSMSTVNSNIWCAVSVYTAIMAMCSTWISGHNCGVSGSDFEPLTVASILNSYSFSVVEEFSFVWAEEFVARCHNSLSMST